MTTPVSYFPTEDPAARYLPARPEPIMIRPAETALIIVDMQNAYASPGGYVDLAGFDVSGAPRAIEKIGQAAEAARAAGMPVIFFQNGWDPDYVEAGGPGSPNWHKSNALKLMRRRPELHGKLLAKGGWDYELVAELPPQPGDIVVTKPRYSAFFNTNLDSLLRARGIRSLVFTGIATNVCVESTLRDAYHREFFAVMIPDATLQAGADFIFEATVFNVQRFFGWTASSEAVVQALRGAAQLSAA
jgi:ureidoacrylate peracid hydrolase